MKRFFSRLAGALIAAITALVALTCRRHRLEDSRIELKAKGIPYILAGLHAQQAAMVFFSDEKTLAAVVSRSTDGDLLASALQVRGITPVRGSSSKNGRDKGGARALVAMIKHVRAGGVGMITVDGPRGPRGSVQPGILKLAERTGAVIVPVLVISNLRVILHKTWDRMQIPLPFSRLDYAFTTPLDPREHDPESLRLALQRSLRELEERYDPEEYALNTAPST